MRAYRALIAAVSVAIVVSTASPLLSAITTVNLTAEGSFATPTADLGGVFRVEQIDPQSTGTGVIDPFVRIQAAGNERGYNTSLGTPLDDKAPSDGFTRALLLSEIPIVTLGTVDYRQFILDINEDRGGPASNSHSLLTLNQIQIFLASADQLHTAETAPTATTPPDISFGAATEIFRMNNIDADWTRILLEYELNHGSGSGDMFLYVPDALFTGADTQNVIFYSQFGDDPNGPSIGSGSSSDGFEEWAVLEAEDDGGGGGGQVPEPASVLIWGLLGLAAVVLGRRRWR